MNHEGIMWVVLIINTMFLFREFAKSIRLSKKLEEVLKENDRLKSSG